MFVIHFIENNSVLLTQLLAQLPSVSEDIKIKGKKGKIISVKNIEKNTFHVQVEIEKVVKKQATSKDAKQKKR